MSGVELNFWIVGQFVMKQQSCSETYQCVQSGRDKENQEMEPACDCSGEGQWGARFWCLQLLYYQETDTELQSEAVTEHLRRYCFSFHTELLRILMELSCNYGKN